MRDIAAILLVFVTSVSVVYLTKFYPTNSWAVVLTAVLVNIASSPIYVGLIEILYNMNQLPLWFKTKIWYRNHEVRLSISYLFRIKVQDKYLLVKNGKWDQYQLVGGAYKTLPGHEKVFKKLEVKPDSLIETEHGIAKNDLRFTLPGKNVLSIIKWFHSREDREISQWREFCEELLSTNILDKQIFRYIDYNYVTTIQTPMKKAKNRPNQEILIYEIFDLVPTTEQNNLLTDLLLEGDKDYIKWAKKSLIDCLGFNESSKEFEYVIGAHTKWSINEKWSND
ncbi:SMODS-associated NUDIX domain-containing protein [Spirosoma litoris]